MLFLSLIPFRPHEEDEVTAAIEELDSILDEYDTVTRPLLKKWKSLEGAAAASSKGKSAKSKK